MQRLRWLQLQIVQLRLHVGSVPIKTAELRRAELLHLDHGELVVHWGLQLLPWRPSRLQVGNLILQPGLVDAAVASLFQAFGIVSSEAEIGARTLVRLKCL